MHELPAYCFGTKDCARRDTCLDFLSVSRRPEGSRIREVVEYQSPPPPVLLGQIVAGVRLGINQFNTNQSVISAQVL